MGRDTSLVPLSHQHHNALAVLFQNAQQPLPRAVLDETDEETDRRVVRVCL